MGVGPGTFIRISAEGATQGQGCMNLEAPGCLQIALSSKLAYAIARLDSTQLFWNNFQTSVTHSFLSVFIFLRLYEALLTNSRPHSNQEPPSVFSTNELRCLRCPLNHFLTHRQGLHCRPHTKPTH